MKAQVHRFRDKVAVYVGDGSTVYMLASEATQLAKALSECSEDIERLDFVKSEFTTVEIELEE